VGAVPRVESDVGARPLRLLLGEVYGPELLQSHQRFVGAHPEVLTEGYATKAEHEQGADYYWICKACFDDFADLFQWRVVRPG
jgi:hypothetical protein